MVYNKEQLLYFVLFVLATSLLSLPFSISMTAREVRDLMKQEGAKTLSGYERIMALKLALYRNWDSKLSCLFYEYSSDPIDMEDIVFEREENKIYGKWKGISFSCNVE